MKVKTTTTMRMEDADKWKTKPSSPEKEMLMKDGGGAPPPAAASVPNPSFFPTCLDLKPFMATVVLLTLVIAVWQLQPYQSLIISSSSSRPQPCPLIGPTTTTTITNTLISLTNITTSSTPTPSVVAPKQKLAGPSTPNPSPNKRTFTPHGSAAALFVQMGAYRGGPSTFAVVGLASKPTHVYGKPWYKCEWVPSSGSPPVRAKAYKMLPDWGYGRVYTVVVVNCTFPSNPNSDNAGGKLLLYAYYGLNPRKFEKFAALEESPGSYDPSRFLPPFKYDYLYCGSSLYGNLSASRIREWVAYHAHFFGPRSHFVFHDAGGVSPAVRSVLQPWVKAGRATIQDIRDQEWYDGYYYNQFLVVNDCLHRHRHSANWTFYFDVDEYLFLPDGRSLESVMGELRGYTQFTIEQNPMSSKLCVKGSDYSKEWGFEKLVFRNSVTGVRRDRKYAIQARNAYAAGVHMSENVVGRTTHKTEALIRYYHYHNSINVVGEPCREFVPMPAKGNVTLFEKTPYVYDGRMKRVADKIKRFEQQTIGAVRS